MSASLNARGIAEGGETGEQAEFLTEEGCAEAQGDHFRHPLQAKHFGALLGAGISRVPVH